jgi:hypothetical protein
MTNSVGILCGDKILKRVFSSILLILTVFFLIVFSLNTPLAHAQNVPYADNYSGSANQGGPQSSTGGPARYTPGAGGPTNPLTVGGDPTVFADGPTTDADVRAAQAAAAESAYAAQNLGSTPDGVLGFIHTYVLTGIGWLVGQAGKAFDYAISEFIVGFGRLYISGTGETIDTLWGTVRDIFNLTFIFGLVYIGFKMILDSSDSSARKMLVSLIGAALLVNFSLFITKFVVDFSNIAATQVYNAFATTGGTLSITNGFMTIMGITSMMGYEYTTGGSFAYVIGMLLVFSVLAYVFLAGAIMIIIRFVVLNIYMVFSPFMFLGWVFPALQGYSREYWSGFLRQAFFAPAFIFMLYLSYQVASTFPVQRDLANMFNPNGSTVTDAPGLIPYFALVIVFLCASMVVAKKMGAHGSTMAVSVGKNITGRAKGALGAAAGGATFGLAARAGRNTFGAGAQRLSQNERFKKFTAKAPFGKTLYNSTTSVADASFDARKVAGVGKSLGIGEGKKGGYATRLKESKESDEKFLKALGTIDKNTDPKLIALRKEVEAREIAFNNASNGVAKRSANSMLVKARQDLATAEAAFGPAQEYANQLAYIKATENWMVLKKRLSLAGAAAAGVGASIVTGGVLAGVAVAAAGAANIPGAQFHTNNDIKALRKSYGEDGSKMKDKKKEEESLKKMMAILKETEPKKDKAEDKKDDH